MKQEIKKHLISFAITFVAMFLFFLYPAIEAGNWEIGVVVAAMLAASRAALKFAWELFILPLLTKLVEWSKNNINKNA